MRTGSISEHAHLLLLDPVFHVSSCAVDILVECAGATFFFGQRCYDKTGIGPLVQMLGLGNDPALITSQMPGIIDDGKNQAPAEQLQQQVVALGQQVQQLTVKTQQQDELIKIQHEVIQDKNLDRAMKLKEVELKTAAEAARTAADLHKHTVDKGIELFKHNSQQPADNSAAEE